MPVPVEVVEVLEPRDPELRRRLERSAMERGQLARPPGVASRGRFARRADTARVRRPARCGVAPLVVVAARTPDDEARVVGRAAADDLRSQQRRVALVLPVVTGIARASSISAGHRHRRRRARSRGPPRPARRRPPGPRSAARRAGVRRCPQTGYDEVEGLPPAQARAPAGTTSVERSSSRSSRSGRPRRRSSSAASER